VPAYYVLVALFCLASVPVWPDAWPFVASHYVPLAVLVAIVGAVAVVRERIRGDTGARWLTEYRAAVGRVRPLARLRHALPVLLTYPLAISCYVGWRLWLNREVAFAWDARIAAIEGQWAAEMVVEALASVPFAYRATEFLYGLMWLLMTLGVMTWVAFAGESRARTRYFVTLAIVFPLAGNLLAGLLMSAGPVYYGAVADGPDVYAPTLALIDVASTYMRPGHHALWSWHEARAGFPSTGVTAMPSMHLVVTTLGACWGWSRGWRALAVGVVAFTLIGSVATGWHYWSDGVVGIAVVLIVWRLTPASRSSGART
jgi:hypothetical protein